MESLTWKNAEGLQLYAHHWKVDHPKAVIALVHGQGEHIRRYDHLAAWFNARDIAVVGFDHQGYGQSEGKKGHARNLDAYLNDIGLLLENVKGFYPEAPVFLYGHSMGGNLVLNYVLRRKPAIKGMIVTGPWIRLAFETPALKVAVGRMLRRFMPGLTMPTGLAAHFISRDPGVVHAYKNDPHVHGKVSAAAGIALLEGANWIDHYKGDISVPALLLHGGADRLTSAPATRELATRLSGNITHKEWAGLYHEIHNEPEKDQVFAFIYQWMNSVWV
jgi:alpha-beta hydrolase superfamily lysophospholipase